MARHALLGLALLAALPAGCATTLVDFALQPRCRTWARPVALDAVRTHGGALAVRIQFADGTERALAVQPGALERYDRHPVQRDLPLPPGEPVAVAQPGDPPPRDGLRLRWPEAKFELEVWEAGACCAVIDAFGSGVSLRWSRQPWQLPLALLYPLAVAFDLVTAPLQLVTYEAWLGVLWGWGVVDLP